LTQTPYSVGGASYPSLSARSGFRSAIREAVTPFVQTFQLKID
jgi:hypothetical protein